MQTQNVNVNPKSEPRNEYDCRKKFAKLFSNSLVTWHANIMSHLTILKITKIISLKKFG